MFIDVNNFTFSAHWNSLSSKPKTNHENKLAKMNNQTRLLLLIYIKKYLQKRNSSHKFKLILGRINLLRMLTRTIMDNSVCCYYHSPKKLKRQRRYWAMKYEQSWFDKMWMNRHNDIYWKLWQKKFRMSPSTFEYIIDLVEQKWLRQILFSRR